MDFVLKMKIKSYTFICIFISSILYSQSEINDSISKNYNDKFKIEKIALPALLIGYGLIGIESDEIKNINQQAHLEIHEHIDKRITYDDFSQYLPFVSVYGLNTFGIKGQNNFRDRTLILATAYLIMGATINSLKGITAIQRPDGSTFNSFPSGHTATAFMGAEFLYQEYKNTSAWYGIFGYTIALGTGYFRMHNDRHWFTDVLTGAGIGILSTKIAYWIHPFLANKVFKKKTKSQKVIMPTVSGEELGLGFTWIF